MSKHYNYFMFILSVYVIVALSVEFAANLPESVSQFLTIIDTVICAIFLIDWVYHIYKSDSRSRYFFAHIPDLISSIPIIPGFRILRVFRIFRFVRGLKGIVFIFKNFRQNPLGSSLVYYSIYLATIYSYCSLAFYKYEFSINERLMSFTDVLWMSFTTLTTIGYGDVYPVTTEGRIIAMILVLSGTGFFALLSGEIAALLIKARKESTK